MYSKTYYKTRSQTAHIAKFQKRNYEEENEILGETIEDTVKKN